MNHGSHIPHTIIIGAGITGLSAAWYLIKMAKDRQVPLTVTILEERERVGGKISSELVGDDDKKVVIEGAADSFLTQKPWARELIEELGIADQLVPIERPAHPTYTLIDGKLREMPRELMMMVPMNWKTFLQTPIFTPWGKLRFMADLVIPKRDHSSDESLGGFVRRRFGAEAVDRMAEPLMSGIYNADPYQQSINATFPQYTTTEREYGSVIRGTLIGRTSTPTRSSAPLPPFLTLRDGMATLTDTLAQRLADQIRTQCAVSTIEHAEHGYIVRLAHGETLVADSVIVTTPAYTAAAMLKNIAPLAQSDLHSIEYLSTGTMALAYHATDVALPIDGYGVVIPRSEQRELNAITIVNRKFTHRAPKDTILIRAFFGGAKNPDAIAFNDVQLLSMAKKELQAILGIAATPKFVRIQRMHRGSPQYSVGHLDRVSRIEHDLPANIFVTGSAYRGIGIPDCIKQGKETAARILSNLPHISSAASLIALSKLKREQKQG